MFTGLKKPIILIKKERCGCFMSIISKKFQGWLTDQESEFMSFIVNNKKDCPESIRNIQEAITKLVNYTTKYIFGNSLITEKSTLTDAEFKALQKYAKACGVNLNDYAKYRDLLCILELDVGCRTRNMDKIAAESYIEVKMGKEARR